MLVIKYKKFGSASWVSHIDMLKTMIRVCYRAGLKVDFSEGYNPHMLLFFSPPSVVGVESVCEYATISTLTLDDTIERFNKNAPLGFLATDAFVVEKNPNLAKEITSAEYVISCDGIGSLSFDKIFENNEFVIEYKDKDETKQKDYLSYVLDITPIGNDEIKVKLKFGNENLRPDRFLSGLEQFFGLEKKQWFAQKTEVFAGDQTADEFLAGKAIEWSLAQTAAE